MRDLKRVDFIVRLSFLVLEEREEGREMRPEPDCEVLVEDVGVDFEVALDRMEGRFLGAVGAWCC